MIKFDIASDTASRVTTIVKETMVVLLTRNATGGVPYGVTLMLGIKIRNATGAELKNKEKRIKNNE